MIRGVFLIGTGRYSLLEAMFLHDFLAPFWHHFYYFSISNIPPQSHYTKNSLN